YGSLNALVVGATDRSGGVASYSSAVGNAKWGLVAPGGSSGGPGSDILSTYPQGRYAWVAGTSMAAPHVSGAVALLLAQGLSPSAAVQRLLGTLDRTSCGTGCQGRLNVAAAVGASGAAAPAVTAPPTTVPAPRPTTATSAPSGPAPTTATTLPAVPATVAPEGVATADPGATRLAALPLGIEAGGVPEPARAAVLALAVALIGGVGGATALVGWRLRPSRLRAGERW
ncbi:MAG TPA: S8 family serine peptidase, partial [Acidimicrobiales bacterium]|nr:S8 family serine peptidase [Acidimicrobiales bacterium]